MKHEKLKSKEPANSDLDAVIGSFYSLINRLQACMYKKYPERGIWNTDTYYDIAFNVFGLGEVA
jgi:hypothetical protein